MRDRAAKIEIAMLAAIVAAAAVSAIQPHSYAVWATEIFWVAGLLAVLLSTRRRTSSATPSARSALPASSSGALDEMALCQVEMRRND